MRFWSRPLVWCRTGHCDKCPYLSSGRWCPHECHKDEK